jgi:NAD(P)-dependent dehydrogenase (short-subunit alcohol dehydrogenase family)
LPEQPSHVGNQSRRPRACPWRKGHDPLGGWCHAPKYALEGYSDALRNEVAYFGINVVVIQPSGIETKWSGIAAREAERYSGQGAYADFVSKFHQRQGQLGQNPLPKIISDLIVKALKAKHPAARYHGGGLPRRCCSCGGCCLTA